MLCHVSAQESIAVLVAGRELVRTGTARAVREQLGLSTVDIAREIGVTVSTVSLWERGLRSPRGERGDAYVRLVYHLIFSVAPVIGGTADTAREREPVA
jgi:DNA-binding transcriptional regulator YiaG